MLEANAERILAALDDDALVLDVGGWAKPFPRADWIIDLMPYATRGGGAADPSGERFGAETWVERDICDREPWPFDDDRFDFVVCSHTLEDVRDPIWVSAEISRVGRAGYVEVPSRLEEQAWGVAGEWVGWSHHRWLVDVETGGLSFVFKPHVIHARASYYLPAPLGSLLTDAERVSALEWEGGFSASERIFFDHEEFEEYLAGFVRDHRAELEARVQKSPLRNRIRRRGR